MASQPIPTDPKYLIDLVIKRRWIVLIPFFLAMAMGIALAVKLPKIYESSTLILIQPQRVPQNYVQSLVTSDPADRINSLSQQILSRTNLEKIIQQFNLYTDPKYDALYIEDKIKNLRERIFVSVTRDRRSGADAFSIAFQGQDPQTVMNITNTLASYFIDENLRTREAQAVGTSDFLDDELETMRKRLEEVEERLKKYRETYMGELPEQLDSNLRILDRLQEQLGERQQRLSDAKIRLAALHSQISDSRRQGSAIVINQGEPEEPTDLEQMKILLENLRSRYTERHPDVIRLRKQIQDLEKSAGSAVETQDEIQSSGSPDTRTASIPQTFRAQLVEIKNEIKALEEDIQSIKTEISTYQHRVENTPKREQELLSLRRDYQNIQATYDSLLERKLEAEIAVNMERKQKGEQFRILDPARMPEKPIKPNMKKLFFMIVAAGLALGGGIVFLREFLDNSFKRPEDVEEDLQLPVLCSIPMIIRRKTLILKRLERASCAVFGMLSFLLFAGFALLSLKGVGPTLELIKKLGVL